MQSFRTKLLAATSRRLDCQRLILQSVICSSPIQCRSQAHVEGASSFRFLWCTRASGHLRSWCTAAVADHLWFDVDRCDALLARLVCGRIVLQTLGKQDYWGRGTHRKFPVDFAT